MKRITPILLALVMFVAVTGYFVWGVPFVYAANTSVRASSNNSASTGTAISVSAPTGTTAGDVVVVSVSCNGNTTLVDNNGATPFTEDINDYQPVPANGMTVSLFSRRIVGGDPSTYNFTCGASGRWAVVAVAFQNPNASSIYDVSPNTGAGAAARDDSTASTISAPSITTATDNSVHVICGYSDDGTGGAMTVPAGYANQGQPVNEPQTCGTKTITPAGATGAQTITATTNSPMAALSFSIKNIDQATTPTPHANLILTNQGNLIMPSNSQGALILP